MKALLIVAHGSRRAASNDEVRALTQVVAERAGDTYVKVSCAFLELADPPIPVALEGLIQTGVKDVTVVPYFLSAGRHVVEDIPAEVAKADMPAGTRVQIAPHIGESVTSMADVLLGQASRVEFIRPTD